MSTGVATSARVKRVDVPSFGRLAGQIGVPSIFDARVHRCGSEAEQERHGRYFLQCHGSIVADSLRLASRPHAIVQPSCPILSARFVALARTSVRSQWSDLDSPTTIDTVCRKTKGVSGKIANRFRRS